MVEVRLDQIQAAEVEVVDKETELVGLLVELWADSEGEAVLPVEDNKLMIVVGDIC